MILMMIMMVVVMMIMVTKNYANSIVVVDMYPFYGLIFDEKRTIQLVVPIGM